MAQLLGLRGPARVTRRPGAPPWTGHGMLRVARADGDHVTPPRIALLGGSVNPCGPVARTPQPARHAHTRAHQGLMGLSAGATPYFGRRPEKRSPRQPTGLSSAVHCNARLPAETHWLRHVSAFDHALVGASLAEVGQVVVVAA